MDSTAGMAAPANTPNDVSYTFGEEAGVVTVDPVTLSGSYCTQSDVVYSVSISVVPAGEDTSWITTSSSASGTTVSYYSNEPRSAGVFTVTVTATLTTNYNTFTETTSFDINAEAGNFYAPVFLNGL